MRQLLSYAVFLLVFGIVNYATAALTDDLVVYFTFDNVKGERILDESGNELDAEINENTKFVKGKYGDAIQIKAATENCVNIPVSDVLKISDEISMMAWVYQEKWRGSSVQWFDKGVFTPMQHQSYGMAVYDKMTWQQQISWKVAQRSLLLWAVFRTVRKLGGSSLHQTGWRIERGIILLVLIMAKTRLFISMGKF